MCVETPAPERRLLRRSVDPGDRRRSVVISDGGNGQSRSALAAVRALAAADFAPVVAISEGTVQAHHLAASSRRRARIDPIPPATAPDYPDALRNLVERVGAVGLILASDASLVALDRPEARLVDKDLLAARSAEIDTVHMPVSIRATGEAEAVAAAADVGFPLVLKPVVSTFPAVIVHDESELRDLVGRQPGVDMIVQPFLTGSLEAVSGVMRGGRLRAVVHQRALRTWPVSAGTSCAAVTIDRRQDRERGLSELLGDVDGIFQAQFLDDHLIDVNPRVYGSHPLAVAAGVNLVAMSVDDSLLPVDEVRVAPPGVRYRWLEGDLRHLAQRRRDKALSNRDVAVALAPRRHTAHSVFEINDPGPALARLRFARSRP